MIDTFNIAVSILIGLFTSGIFYFQQRKQMTNVERERIKQGNEKIENIVLREMIRDRRKFSLNEIKKLIIAQSTLDNIDFHVLKGPEIIINEVQYRIIENEYLEPRYKDKLLQNIREISECFDKECKEKEIKKIEEREISISPPFFLTIGVGLLALTISLAFFLYGANVSILDPLVVMVPLIILIIFFTTRIILRKSISFNR